MIKKLIISLFIFTGCFGSENDPKDPFAWIDKEFASPAAATQPSQNEGNQQAAPQDQGAESNALQPQPSASRQFVLHWGTDKTKIFERIININVQRATLLFASSFLGVYSARALLQKKPHFKIYFLFASSLLSFFYNKELVTILNNKKGKYTLATLIFAYLHKEIAQTLLPTEVFKRIYKI